MVVLPSSLGFHSLLIIDFKKLAKRLLIEKIRI